MEHKKNDTKCYMLDTSAILDDPMNIVRLADGGENQVFLNNVVYSEMNKMKKSEKSEAGMNAREFFRMINEHPLQVIATEDAPACLKSLLCDFSESNGDKLIQFTIKREGPAINVYSISRATFRSESSHMEEIELSDMKIAEVALDYNMTLITNDAGLHMYMQMNDGKSEFLLNDTVESTDLMEFEQIYHFPKKETLDFSINEYIQYFSAIEKLSQAKRFTQFTLIETDTSETGEIFETGKQLWAVKLMGVIEVLDVDPKSRSSCMHGSLIKYKSKEQAMYHAILTSPDLKVIAVSGATGSGKTLLALNAGVELVKSGEVDGIIYTRNTVTSNDPASELGFRKGGEEQKLGYFMMPLFGAINLLVEKSKKADGKAFENQTKYTGETNSMNKESATETFMKEHKIEVVDIAHLRGTTISNKLIIIDESQNMPTSSMKLIGTRVGEESRLIIMGDAGQIDHPYLTPKRNALAKMLSLATKDDFVAGIKLHKTERSDVAEWFDKSL